MVNDINTKQGSVPHRALEDEFGNCIGLESWETEAKFTTAISMVHNFSKALAYSMII